MKKIILFVLSIVLVNLVYSQTVEESIKNAEKLFNQKKYNEAIQQLNQATKEIENAYMIEIKSDLLPQTIVDYSVKNIENSEMSQSFILGNRVQINQIYVKEDGNGEPENKHEVEHTESVISITISNIPEKMCEIANIHSMNNNESIYESESLIPIKFNDYRAVIYFSEESKQGNFAAIIGGAVIEIVSENLESKMALIEMANKIDIDKIIKYFGK